MNGKQLAKQYGWEPEWTVSVTTYEKGRIGYFKMAYGIILPKLHTVPAIHATSEHSKTQIRRGMREVFDLNPDMTLESVLRNLR